jgi:hypothetical protein
MKIRPQRRGQDTVFNAYTWLLFGKASDGSANFSPKLRKGDGDLHNVDTSVEMAFTCVGREHKIAHVFSEVWKSGGATRHLNSADTKRLTSLTAFPRGKSTSPNSCRR